MKKKPISSVNLTPYVKKSTHNSLGLSGEGSYDRSLSLIDRDELKVILLCPLSEASYFSGIIRASDMQGMYSEAAYIDIERISNTSARHLLTPFTKGSTSSIKRAQFRGEYYAAYVCRDVRNKQFKIMSAVSSHEVSIQHINSIYLIEALPQE